MLLSAVNIRGWTVLNSVDEEADLSINFVKTFLLSVCECQKGLERNVICLSAHAGTGGSYNQIYTITDVQLFTGGW